LSGAGIYFEGMAQMSKYFARGLAAALFVAGSAAFGTSHGASIGWAYMTPNGTIQLDLRAGPIPAPVTRQGTVQVVPLSPPQEILGYGQIELQPSDTYYGELLRHVGGLRPGETKPVPIWRANEKWHCALDPHRGPCALQHLVPST
jgi:hypothetical protein